MAGILGFLVQKWGGTAQAGPVRNEAHVQQGDDQSQRGQADDPCNLRPRDRFTRFTPSLARVVNSPRQTSATQSSLRSARTHERVSIAHREIVSREALRVCRVGSQARVPNAGEHVHAMVDVAVVRPEIRHRHRLQVAAQTGRTIGTFQTSALAMVPVKCGKTPTARHLSWGAVTVVQAGRTRCCTGHVRILPGCIFKYWYVCY